MADDDPRTKYKTARKRLRQGRDDGEITDADYDAITEFLDAKDPDKVSVHPGRDADGDPLKTKAPGTLWSYTTRLNRIARQMDVPLTEATADDVNNFTDALLSGTHPEVKGGGLAPNTVNGYQSSARQFYEYHDFGPQKDEIVTVDPEKNNVSERDVFDKEDIQAMREAIEHPRDRALFEMLLYTGQRIRALLTLRIRDVKPDDGATGAFYLNTDADGLKGADKTGEKRPLLGAKKAVREWLQYHPESDDPDAAVFVPKRKGVGKFTESIGHSAVWKMLRDVVDRAGVEKPCNPHNFRHTAVTVMKREYDLDDGEIKWMIGHDSDSKVMETTYAHLTDEDRRKKVEVDAGYRDPPEESTLTPPTCDTCDAPLPDGAKACPECGHVYTLDAQSAKEEMEKQMRDHYREAARDDKEDVLDGLDDAAELLEDPRIRAALVELAEEVDDDG